jgi:hypothetical protein
VGGTPKQSKSKILQICDACERGKSIFLRNTPFRTDSARGSESRREKRRVRRTFRDHRIGFFQLTSQHFVFASPCGLAEGVRFHGRLRFSLSSWPALPGHPSRERLRAQMTLCRRVARAGWMAASVGGHDEGVLESKTRPGDFRPRRRNSEDGCIMQNQRHAVKTKKWNELLSMADPCAIIDAAKPPK